MAAAKQRTAKGQLRVSAYDRVSGWLVSMLVISCVTVGSLVLVFFTKRFVLKDFSAPITPISTGGGGTGGMSGSPGGADLEPPGMEDAPAFDEPQIENTLTAVASAVSDRTAMLADDTIEVGIEPQEGRGAGDNRTPGFGGGRGGGAGGGIGSGFGKGRGGAGEPRREIRFEPASLLEYAQWLDYFKIELGVLGQDNKVYYAYNLSRPKPDVRVGDPAQEQRLYMNPTDSQFAALDKQLVEKAGLANKGQIILQFYPAEAQGILVTLEQKQAGTRKPEQIRGTVFRVTHTGGRFEFSVEQQTYR